MAMMHHYRMLLADLANCDGLDFVKDRLDGSYKRSDARMCCLNDDAFADLTKDVLSVQDARVPSEAKELLDLLSFYGAHTVSQMVETATHYAIEQESVNESNEKLNQIQSKLASKCAHIEDCNTMIGRLSSGTTSQESFKTVVSELSNVLTDLDNQINISKIATLQSEVDELERQLSML